MKTQRCKGTRDLSPEKMIGFRLIEEAFRECCLKWGYEEAKTPTIEYLPLFTSTGTLTPSMLHRVYSFLDWDGWSGERVVLRPDGTIPIARFYNEIMPKKELAKLFYVTNIFIFEETGNNTRERWQGGAELIGAGSPLADVELITLALAVLKGLGFKDIELKLSHAGLIRALLARLSLNPVEQTRIFDQMLDGDVEALARIKPERPELSRALRSLLELKGEKSGFLKNMKTLLAQDLPELAPYLDDFTSITTLLENLDCDYHIDINSGRGFEYYTGVISHLFIGKNKVGGGGRYDALIPLMGGRNAPASGFALYLDPLMDLIKTETLAKPRAPRILITAEPELMKESFSIASCLRDAGYIAEFNLGGREITNSTWALDIRHKEPSFILTNRTTQRKLKLKTAGEVLTLLGEEGADKDSVT